MSKHQLTQQHSFAVPMTRRTMLVGLAGLSALNTENEPHPVIKHG